MHLKTHSEKKKIFSVMLCDPEEKCDFEKLICSLSLDVVNMEDDLFFFFFFFDDRS